MNFEEKTQKFDELVDSKAKEIGKRFFVKDGDGRDFENEQFAGEDLYGWLIPEDQVDKFVVATNLGRIPQEFDKFLCFAEWRIENEEIKIKFTKTID